MISDREEHEEAAVGIVLPELANLLWAQWEQALSLELATGQSIPWVFHWNDNGTLKEIHPKALYHRWKTACRRAGVPTRIPHDFRSTAVRNLERAGVPRSVAMKLTGHKTEAVYRRYAIVCEADLTEGLKKLAVLEHSLRGPVELSHSSATISGISSQKPRIMRENMAEGARFELADPLRGLQFSRLARSATPSPLQIEHVRPGALILQARWDIGRKHLAGYCLSRTRKPNTVVELPR